MTAQELTTLRTVVELLNFACRFKTLETTRYCIREVVELIEKQLNGTD